MTRSSTTFRLAAPPWRRSTRAIALASPLSVSAPVLAHAAVRCADLPSPTLVYGSTAAKPLLANVASALAESASPVTVLYGGVGSCAGVNAPPSLHPDFDWTADGGAVCYPYQPETNREFQNACEEGCVPFTTLLPLLRSDGNLPALPNP